jgi:hypothetical protein
MRDPQGYCKEIKLSSKDGRHGTLINLEEASKPWLDPTVEPLVTVKTAAELLEISIMTTRGLVWKRRLRATTVKKNPAHAKGLTLIFLSSIRKLMEAE